MGWGGGGVALCESLEMGCRDRHLTTNVVISLVGACDGDWVMEHLKELDINFLAKFCNLFHPFEPVYYWCIVSSLCIVLSRAPCGLLE